MQQHIQSPTLYHPRAYKKILLVVVNSQKAVLIKFTPSFEAKVTSKRKREQRPT